MKRISLLFMSILALAIAIIVCVKMDASKSSHINVANDKKINSIKAKSEEKDLAFWLCFDGEELPYDSGSKTFYLPLDMEETFWETGEFSGYCVKVDDENQKKIKTDIFFLDDFTKQDKKEAISKGQSFPFIVVSKDGYSEYHIVFTGLPMITFEGSEYVADDGTQLFKVAVFDINHKTNYEYQDKTNTKDKNYDWVTRCYTKARLRGNTSLTYEKKSLRLYLKDVNDDGSTKKTSKNLLGLRDDDDWILNSLYADNSRIRDQLCIDLWNEVGAMDQPYNHNFGTQAKMVEVFINNNYQGVYSLMVPVDAKQLGLDAVSEQITENADVIERIYKKKYGRDWISSDFVGDVPDPNATNYRGGFYLKGDTVLENEEEWEPLYRIATDLESDDQGFSEDICKFNDQQNLIDNWLFYQAVAGFDNVNKNYLYVVRNRDGKGMGYFIPWDLNISFGMVYAENEFYSENKPEAISETTDWQPAQRMIELNVNHSQSLLKDTWAKWRKNAFSDENITNRISNLEHQIKDSGAFARENNRYPNGNQDGDFSYLYDFATKRLAFVDEYVDEMTK